MALFDSGTPLANVALSDTFNTWRVRTNQINTQAAGLASNNTFTGTNNIFNGTLQATTANFTTLQADAIDFDGDLTVDDVTANTVTSASIVVSGITANSIIVGAGASSATGVSPGATGQVLTSNGSAWLSQASTGGSESYRYQYTATAAQTTFSATYDVGFVDVFLNGIKLLVSTDFTATNGSTVVLATGATVGDIVDIMAFGSFSVADVYSQAASNARFAQLSNNLSDLASAPAALISLGLTADAAEINKLDGVTASTAELNKLAGVTASTAEINTLTGVTSTATELNYTNVTTLGTSEASKAVTADANGDVALAAELKATSYNETYVALSGTTPAADCEAGNMFSLTTSGSTTFTFSNPPATGTAYGMVIKLVAGGTHAITWPTSVDWAGGTAPDAPASGETDVLGFITHDGGTTWYGFLAGDALQ